jgi:hypothetical protein
MMGTLKINFIPCFMGYSPIFVRFWCAVHRGAEFVESALPVRGFSLFYQSGARVKNGIAKRFQSIQAVPNLV